MIGPLIARYDDVDEARASCWRAASLGDAPLPDARSSRRSARCSAAT